MPSSRVTRAILTRLFLLEGMMDVIGADVESGKIKIVGEAFTDGWKPDNAQKNMEQILTANNNNVDAVMSENDGMAGGAIAALQAQGMNIPVSGQDGDHAALNRVARGSSEYICLERCPSTWCRRREHCCRIGGWR